MKALTAKDLWEENYVTRDEIVDCHFGWREHVNTLLAKQIEGIGLDGKRVLEVGAGDSQWLPYLANKYPDSKFAGLDYSEAGCERLARRVASLREKTTVDIYHQDLFAMDSALHGTFDLVLSFGVVEHFTELSDVLSAKRRYLKDDGAMFTLIPNMTGLTGFLTKRFNRSIYDMHNPHDLESFLEGHRKAGLSVTASGYLGSTNFGVLSICFKEAKGLSWHSYVFLTRLSKAIWFLENKAGNLPATRILSPYIFATSRVIP